MDQGAAEAEASSSGAGADWGREVPSRQVVGKTGEFTCNSEAEAPGVQSAWRFSLNNRGPSHLDMNLTFLHTLGSEQPFVRAGSQLRTGHSSVSFSHSGCWDDNLEHVRGKNKKFIFVFGQVLDGRDRGCGSSFYFREGIHGL